MATSYSSIRAATGLSPRITLHSKPTYYAPPKPDTNPFGPNLANEIFELWGVDEACESCEPIPDIFQNYAEHEHEYWYQVELPLENVRDLEERYRQEIRKFERAYKKMMIYALQWHYLLEECEDNAQVEKMFKDMQMIRKLTGSDAV